jgi:flagellar basal body-associated protein FliL
LSLCGNQQQVDTRREAVNRMSILWIILIVILVLALLGFFSRGRW